MIVESGGNKCAWFGPKRIGYGVRPQTWQGWLLTLLPAVVIVIIVSFIR